MSCRQPGEPAMIATAVSPWLEPEVYQALGQECNCSLARRKYGEKYVVPDRAPQVPRCSAIRRIRGPRTSRQEAGACAWDHVVRRHFLMMMMMVVNVDSEVNPKSSYLSVASILQ